MRLTRRELMRWISLLGEGLASATIPLGPTAKRGSRDGRKARSRITDSHSPLETAETATMSGLRHFLPAAEGRAGAGSGSYRYRL